MIPYPSKNSTGQTLLAIYFIHRHALTDADQPAEPRVEDSDLIASRGKNSV